MAKQFTSCPACNWIWYRRHKGDFSDERDYCGSKNCRKGTVPMPETPEEWAAYYEALPPARCDNCHAEIKLTVENPNLLKTETSSDGTFFLCPRCINRGSHKLHA